MGEGEWGGGAGLRFPLRPPHAPPNASVPWGRPAGAPRCVAGGRLTGAHLSRRALGVSVTDYTYDDCQLALAEGQLRLPADTCLLEFARLARGLG